MKKIFVLLFLICLSNCTSLDVFEKVKIECPKITSPHGSEELIVDTINKTKTYIGLRGIKKNCFKKNSLIMMDLEVNVRVIRRDYKIDDNIEVTLSLVSIDKSEKEYDRDDFHANFFLKENNKIVEIISEMSVEVPVNGSVLLGLYQK